MFGKNCHGQKLLKDYNLVLQYIIECYCLENQSLLGYDNIFFQGLVVAEFTNNLYLD